MQDQKNETLGMAAKQDQDISMTNRPAEEHSTEPAVERRRRQISCKNGAAMLSLVSETFSGWSNQIEITQELIDQFATLSGDNYWIHTDPVKAHRESPFGATIAHGWLVQILISRMQLPLDYEITEFKNMVNYGSDRMRFVCPVPSGCRIHARNRIKAVQAVKSGIQLTMEINIHVVGQERPSVINDQLILYM
jgi:acyl dehydratase